MSHDFGDQVEDRSFNFHMPDELCSVKYRDLDHAVENCLKLIEKFVEVTGKSAEDCVIYISKTDLTAAFR